MTACYLGDGASNQGTFHESLNMASLWSLPIVYVCENNLYGMSVHVRDSTAVEYVHERAAGYAMQGVMADGMDAHNVYEVVRPAVRAGEDRGVAVLPVAARFGVDGRTEVGRLVAVGRDTWVGTLVRSPALGRVVVGRVGNLRVVVEAGRIG